MAAAKGEVKKIEDPETWDRFVEESPQGTVFSTLGWMRIAAEAQGGEPVALGVFEGEKLLGGAAFLEIKKGPFRKATTPALTPYGGILHRPFRGKRSSEEESLRHSCAGPLVDHLNRRYDFVYLVHPPSVSDVRPFSWNGFDSRVRYTYHLDIASPDAVWDGFEHRMKTVIRNAEGELTVESSPWTGGFAELYEHVYRDRGGEPPVARGVVERMAPAAIDSCGGDLRIVRDPDGTAVCAGLFVRDGHAVYAWVSGALPSRNSSGAMSCLVWDTVRRYSGSVPVFDMVGANIPGVAFYKRGFGGTLVPYYATGRYGSPFARAVFSLYSHIRKAF
jgi:hypothetical protein